MKKKIILIILLLFCCNINIKADVKNDSTNNMVEINSGSTDTSSDERSMVLPIIAAATTATCVIAFVLYQFGSEKKKEKIDNALMKSKIKDLNEDDIHLIDNNFDISKFKKIVYDKFVVIQKAISELDDKTLKANVTDELYNTQMILFRSLKEKEQKNIMSDFNCINVYINNIELFDDKKQVDVTLVVRYKNYYVDKNNNVIRGQKNQVYEMMYTLSLIQQANDEEWLISSKKLVNQKLEEEVKYYEK